jgi:hypothetical protein
MFALLISALFGVAHPPQLYRFPLLEPLGGRSAACKVSDTNDALGSQGIQRIVTLNFAGEPSRQLAVSIGARNHIIAILGFYSISAGKRRREGESISIFYTTRRIPSGTRYYRTTGIPARREEDYSTAVTAAEADSAWKLGEAVLRRCKVMSNTR